MATSKRKDGEGGATPGTPSSSDKPQPTRSPLSDDLVEQIKHQILFGTGVGYKRPPEHTRFKKGRSGNPKGRPRSIYRGLGGSRSANALILQEAQRLVTIREGDETRQISEIEAVLRSLFKSAAGGNAYAQKHFFQNYDRAHRDEREEIVELIEFWREYADSCREAIHEAERRGEEVPDPLAYWAS